MRRQSIGKSRWRYFYTFGRGTKIRSSLALAFAVTHAVTGVCAELLMCNHGQPLCHRVTAGGVSVAMPGRCCCGEASLALAVCLPAAFMGY